MKLKHFLQQWEADYRQSVMHLSLFMPAVTSTWSVRQKKLFVKLFYHARGHFYLFLWHLANWTPNHKRRVVILRNITDELGGIRKNDDPHEQLYIKFAQSLGVDVHKELITEKEYRPFLRSFNEEHAHWLLTHSADENWAAFSAYELLDNVDYNNLYALARSLKVPTSGLVFFDVHRKGDHYSETDSLLQEIWNKDRKAVIRGFTFIAKHQLSMWRKLGLEVAKQR